MPPAASLGLSQRSPGPSQGSATDRNFDELVGEMRQKYGYRQPYDEQRHAVERHVELRPGNHEDRPVPEIDAVGAQPNPAQRPPLQHLRSELGAGMHHDQDRERRGKPDKRQAATVKKRLEFVDPDKKYDQGAQRQNSGQIQQAWDRPSPAVTEAAPAPNFSCPVAPILLRVHRTPLQHLRHPDEGERGPHEKPGSPGIRTVVEAGRVHTGLVENGHQDDGQKGAYQDAREYGPAPEERHPGDEQCRPDQVELLLDREGPQVLEH